MKVTATLVAVTHDEVVLDAALEVLLVDPVPVVVAEADALVEPPPLTGVWLAGKLVELAVL